MTLEWAKTAKVGDKVVLTKQGKGFAPFGEILPEIGRIYTIREVCFFSPSIFFRLVEIVNKPNTYREGYVEFAFRASRFRPVQTRKTDISIFHEILKSVSERISA